MPDTRGLYTKYVVRRTDGTPVSACFVLELDDPLALPALNAYRQAARRAGRAALADDLERTIRGLERACFMHDSERKDACTPAATLRQR